MPSKRVPHFKAGKELRERVDSGAKVDPDDSAEVGRLAGEQPGNPFLPLVSSVNRAVRTFVRIDRSVAALTTVEAISAYAAAHDGKLPLHLAELTDTPAPNNPATGKAFEYQLAGDTATLSDASVPSDVLRYTIRVSK